MFTRWLFRPVVIFVLLYSGLANQWGDDCKKNVFPPTQDFHQDPVFPDFIRPSFMKPRLRLSQAGEPRRIWKQGHLGFWDRLKSLFGLNGLFNRWEKPKLNKFRQPQRFWRLPQAINVWRPSPIINFLRPQPIYNWYDPRLLQTQLLQTQTGFPNVLPPTQRPCLQFCYNECCTPPLTCEEQCNDLCRSKKFSLYNLVCFNNFPSVYGYPWYDMRNIYNQNLLNPNSFNLPPQPFYFQNTFLPDQPFTSSPWLASTIHSKMTNSPLESERTLHSSGTTRTMPEKIMYTNELPSSSILPSNSFFMNEPTFFTSEPKITPFSPPILTSNTNPDTYSPNFENMYFPQQAGFPVNSHMPIFPYPSINPDTVTGNSFLTQQPSSSLFYTPSISTDIPKKLSSKSESSFPPTLPFPLPTQSMIGVLPDRTPVPNLRPGIVNPVIPISPILPNFLNKWPEPHSNFRTLGTFIKPNALPPPFTENLHVPLNLSYLWWLVTHPNCNLLRQHLIGVLQMIQAPSFPNQYPDFHNNFSNSFPTAPTEFWISPSTEFQKTDQKELLYPPDFNTLPFTGLLNRLAYNNEPSFMNVPKSDVSNFVPSFPTPCSNSDSAADQALCNPSWRKLPPSSYNNEVGILPFITEDWQKNQVYDQVMSNLCATDYSACSPMNEFTQSEQGIKRFQSNFGTFPRESMEMPMPGGEICK